MVTVLPSTPSRTRPEVVSVIQMLPPAFDAAKESILFAALSVIAEPTPLTVRAVATIGVPDWVTAPAAVTVTGPPVMPVMRRSPVESLMATLPPLLATLTDPSLLPESLRVMALPFPVTLRVDASIGPVKVSGPPTVSEAVLPDSGVVGVLLVLIVPLFAESVVKPFFAGAFSIAPALLRVMSEEVAVMAIVLPSPVVFSRPVIVTLVPMIVMLPSVT